jgi:hypothetical protein
MKHSIKDQIGAVNKARKVLNGKTYRQFINNSKTLDLVVEQLNDAASTLSALNFIGQDKVLIAPELINTVKKMLANWNNGESNAMVIGYFSKLEEIIKRLDHE